MKLNTGRLISEMKKRPCLWNRYDDDYKNKPVRMQAWKEVYGSLFPDYEIEDAPTKTKIEKYLHQRWKTARDTYIRCRNILNRSTNEEPEKSRNAYNKEKLYVHFDSLKFLDYNLEDGSEEEVDVEGDNDEDNDSTSSDNKTKPQNSSGPRKRPAPKLRTYGRKRKPSTSNDDPVASVATESTDAYKNDDLCFFMSLLPMTKNFSNRQKLMLRSEILKKIMEIESMPDLKEDIAELELPNSSHCLPESSHDDEEVKFDINNIMKSDIKSEKGEFQ